MTKNTNRRRLGDRAAAEYPAGGQDDTATVALPIVAGVLVATITSTDDAARTALLATCNAAPPGAHLVIRPAARVLPYAVLYGVPLVHLGSITVESSDSAQVARWVTHLREAIAQQHAKQTAAKAAQAQIEAEIEQARAQAEAWRAAHSKRAA